ncbi:hypothetical protein GQ53DRAFT_824117 [Thozetella sp. PMI_491]|nr:hypothetical protein GQ53DRAFT_824117 [Thozetella sp. PMI_491]
MVGFGNFGKMAQDAANSFTQKNENENENENKDNAQNQGSDKSWNDIADSAKSAYQNYEEGSKKGERLNTNEIGQVVKDVAGKYNAAPNKDPAAIGRDAIQGFLGGGRKPEGGAAHGQDEQKPMGDHEPESNQRVDVS